MNGNNKKFDERQLWIRGNIFQRMFLIIAVLVLINALLDKSDIVWADNFYSNLIILFVSVAFGSLEMIFREVYFVNMRQRWIFIMFGIDGLIILAINIKFLITGDAFVSNNSLTTTGSSFIFALLILSIGIGGAVKTIFDKLNNKEKEENEEKE